MHNEIERKALERANQIINSNKSTDNMKFEKLEAIDYAIEIIRGRIEIWRVKSSEAYKAGDKQAKEFWKNKCAWEKELIKFEIFCNN